MLTRETEFSSMYPYDCKINFGGRVAIIDHDQISLRIGKNWQEPGEDSIRLYVATDPKLVVLQQRFLNEGGFARGVKKSNTILPLIVNRSSDRSIIYVVDQEENYEKYVLHYRGKGSFIVYADSFLKLDYAHRNVDLVGILEERRRGW